MGLSVLDHHLDEYLRHDRYAREALDNGDLRLARRELDNAADAAQEILNEAATIEDDLEYLEADIDMAEEEWEDDV